MEVKSKDKTLLMKWSSVQLMGNNNILIWFNILITADSECPLVLMMKDQYANYVVQRMLEVATEDQRNKLIETTRPHLALLKKYPYGKHLIQSK